MSKIKWTKTLCMVPLMVLASVAPNAFPAAQSGYASLHDLALVAILPTAALLGLITIFGNRKEAGSIGRVAWTGAVAGAAATIALEAVRYPGFRLGFMPGNLPELMGVLLLDRFADGPSMQSNVAGFAYHFWNGASFGIIFAALAQIGLVRVRLFWGLVYGVLVGLGFLASPVVQSLGGGFLGADFGWRFAATVLIAHAAFGMALSYGLARLEPLMAPSGVALRTFADHVRSGTECCH